MATPNEGPKQRQRAIKSTPGTSNQHAFDFDERQRRAALTESTAAQSNVIDDDDDDIMICDEIVLSEAAREDLEKALRPTTTHASARRKSTPTIAKPPPNVAAGGRVMTNQQTISNPRSMAVVGQEAGGGSRTTTGPTIVAKPSSNKLTIDSVQIISRDEFHDRPSNSQTGDDDDSDIEIIAIKPAKNPSNRAANAPPTGVVNSSMVAAPGTQQSHQSVRQPHIVIGNHPSMHLVNGVVAFRPPPSNAATGLRTLAPSSSAMNAIHAPPPSMPNLVRYPVPVPPRFASNIFATPPPPTHSTAVRFGGGSSHGAHMPTLQQQPGQQQQQQHVRVVAQSQNGEQRLVSVALSSPNQRQQQGSSPNVQLRSRLNQSSAKPIFPPQLLSPTSNQTKANQSSSAYNPRSGGRTGAGAGDGSLPIFGQHYNGHRPAIAMRPVVIARNQPLSNNRRRRRDSSPSTESSSVSFVTTSSSSIDADKNDDDIPHDGKPTASKRFRAATSAIVSKQPLNSSIKFPDGYYGRLRPSTRSTRSAIQNERFDGLFVCTVCKEVHCTNISFVTHLLNHVLHPSMEDDRLRSQSTCDSCLREFEDPFSCMDHYEKVHRKSGWPVCYICELAFDDEQKLCVHMNERHENGYDMPYYCKICRYRSSLFEDVWNHYLLEHDHSSNLMCPLCLMHVEPQILTNKYSTLEAANTEPFVRHILKHLEVGAKNACTSCKLRFLTPSELNKHQRSFHRSLRPSEMMATKNGAGLINLKWDGVRPLTEVETSGQYVPARRTHRIAAMDSWTSAVKESDCIECSRGLNKEKHYSMVPKKCPECAYVTNCLRAFACHKKTFHRDPDSIDLPLGFSLVPRRLATVLEKPVKCECGYRAIFGNDLAEHITTCEIADGCIELKATMNEEEQNDQKPPIFLRPSIMKALMVQPRNVKSSDQLVEKESETSQQPDEKDDDRQERDADEDRSRIKTTKEIAAEHSILKIGPGDRYARPTLGEFMKMASERSSSSLSSAKDQEDGEITILDDEGPSTSQLTKSPTRPRLMSPQMSHKRQLDSSDVVVEPVVVATSSSSTSKRDSKRSSLRSAKWSKRSLEEYRQLDRKISASEAALEAASDQLSKRARGEELAKRAEVSYAYLQGIEISIAPKPTVGLPRSK